MAGRPTGRYTTEFWQYIASLGPISNDEKARLATEHFGVEYKGHQIRNQAKRSKVKLPTAPQGNPARTTIAVAPNDFPEPPTIEEKIAAYQNRDEVAALKADNRKLIELVNAKERELNAALNITQTPQEYNLQLRPTKSLSTTQVIVWSDWHCDELVRPESVNHLNEFNEKIADRRIQTCIGNTARLMEITAKDAPVDATILQLGGDFISGNIHTELLENTWCRPIDAIIWVQKRIMAGIRHLASVVPNRLLIACNVGNHSRITHKTHFSGEQGNSLEYFMYHNMKDALSDLANVDWMIAEGYHLYVDLYGKSIRFHHGHAVKYGGGIGGIFIPTYKAISLWNKARHADLDVFDHFHQMKNGGNFIVNGSLIGFNPFAIAIKADFERPRQKFFLYTNTGEVCGEYPIFLD